MSGIQDDGSFELTWTKARRWHGSRGCCRSMRDFGRHLDTAGLSWGLGRGGNFIRIAGPGISPDGREIYSALSGPVRATPIVGAAADQDGAPDNGSTR